MTAIELEILVCGLLIGAQAMNCLHVYWGVRDDRRDLAASRQARRRAAADRYFASLRLYQLQHRTEARR